MQKIDFALDGHEFIPLNQLLKVTQVVNSGGMANEIITDGLVIYNGETETRKRKKVYAGDKVEVAEFGFSISVGL
ncbi:MAG: ribosome-associated protein [Sphingobacteriales bacterium]|jgi:ribosome-associated protein